MQGMSGNCFTCEAVMPRTQINVTAQMLNTFRAIGTHPNNALLLVILLVTNVCITNQASVFSQALEIQFRLVVLSGTLQQVLCLIVLNVQLSVVFSTDRLVVVPCCPSPPNPAVSPCRAPSHPNPLVIRACFGLHGFEIHKEPVESKTRTYHGRVGSERPAERPGGVGQD